MKPNTASYKIGLYIRSISDLFKELKKIIPFQTTSKIITKINLAIETVNLYNENYEVSLKEIKWENMSPSWSWTYYS